MTSWIGWMVTAALLTGAEGAPEPPTVPGDADPRPGWMPGAAGAPGACLVLPGAVGPGALRPGAVRGATPDEGPGSPYYAFDLVTTARVPGTARAGGTARAVFASSPFGVAVAPDGSYLYELHLEVDGLPETPDGSYEVWVTTPSLDRIEHQGTLVPGSSFRGSVSWNKFLVVVTLEQGDGLAGPAVDEAGPDGRSAESWSGPILLRGMSRSGMMHTMAGHGPFEQENCATYGYED